MLRTIEFVMDSHMNQLPSCTLPPQPSEGHQSGAATILAQQTSLPAEQDPILLRRLNFVDTPSIVECSLANYREQIGARNAVLGQNEEVVRMQVEKQLRAIERNNQRKMDRFRKASEKLRQKALAKKRWSCPIGTMYALAKDLSDPKHPSYDILAVKHHIPGGCAYVAQFKRRLQQAGWDASVIATRAHGGSRPHPHLLSLQDRQQLALIQIEHGTWSISQIIQRFAEINGGRTLKHGVVSNALAEAGLTFKKGSYNATAKEQRRESQGEKTVASPDRRISVGRNHLGR
eukprot:ANDGO_03683.mRNA.1 hypothetical protein